jgi:AAA15 family ATPase/GTPase
MDGGKPVKLPSLHVRNFRMLEDFTLEKLGRVNLLVGGNNSGKSTVLEAVRAYATAAELEVLLDICKRREENIKYSSAFQSLWTRQQTPKQEEVMRIGEATPDTDNVLIIEIAHIANTEKIEPDGSRSVSTTVIHTSSSPRPFSITDTIIPVWHVRKNNLHQRFISFQYHQPSQINGEYRASPPCEYRPATELMSGDALSKIWKNIALTPKEKTVLQVLKIIEPSIENFTFISDEEYGESALITLKEQQRTFPLRSMGDGVAHALQIALQIHAAQGGFLLIDEFENGLHYSIQEKVWEMVFALAEELDIQVFATTHSRDCISSFAAVANRNKVTEGMLIRMGRSAFTSDNNKVIGTPYTAEELDYAAAMHLDVR